ncbi:FRG domain-containing protein [Vibrio splendidus]|uniref:FRG domain-containing protein n=1 Tax=Vibrio splendidus TaxID=29497 RepID=UPI000D3B8862|nr:FRG domain-containing protein [Vibrio splendidus]PTQ06996.1 FRG domain-containing protein [Vibrio splendidus]
MGRKPRWTSNVGDKGVKNYKLSSWKYFSDFVNQEMLEYTGYVYRGHGCSKWKLEPTIDRMISDPNSYKREAHLNQFMFATRGRRGPSPSSMENENDWWALGQHHGLATPLLDWTESPFVALYFAALGALKEKSKTMSVFALSLSSVEDRNNVIVESDEVELVNNKKPTVKVVRPLSDENARLVSQRGLFTRGPNNIDMENWMKKFATSDSEYYMELIRVDIPSVQLTSCLQYLNRMNINHSTLFPDLSGASEYCNAHLEIENY